LEYGQQVNRRRWADLLRAATLVAMCAAAAASSSSSSKPPEQPQYGAAPPPQAMEITRALGLWKSSFGAVKVQEDLSNGAAPGGGAVHGVWVYQRQGQDVIGYFGGNLRGNVLEFAWQEPAQPPLVGQGYIVFDPSGQRFAGRWWTTNRDRTGEWSGWRQEAQPTPPPNPGYDPYGGGAAYGGSTYGYGYPPP
jgi:hypothetical protein